MKNSFFPYKSFLISSLLTPILASSCFAQSALSVDLKTVPNLGKKKPNSLTFVLNYDEYSTLQSNRQWVRLNLLDTLQYELAKSGYNSDLNNYELKSVQIEAKSFSGIGQVRLCDIRITKRNKYSCLPISELILDGYPEIFDNFSVWGSYHLLISNPNSRISLRNNIDLELQGIIRLNTVIVTLESVYVSPNIPTSPDNQPIPSFLKGKNIFKNSGQSVQLGDRMKLEKDLLTKENIIVFESSNFLFENFKWVNITTVDNDSVITNISVNCLDSRGYPIQFTAQNTRKEIIKDLYFQKGKTLAFEVDHECSYIRSVVVKGYSPKRSGSRARLNVDLN